MFNHVIYGDSLEIVNLAPAENRGDYLVFLCSGKNEYGIFRWFLKRLEKCVECPDDNMWVSSMMKTLYLPCWGRHIYLLDKVADVIDTVVGCGVEFNKVERVASGYCHAGIAFAASLAVGVSAPDS